ncbi:MAG: stage II sporulation protein P [Peptococcaceae bacterium]|nr:stage II sporulation protein P [Peptococcaceae bacterium]
MYHAPACHLRYRKIKAGLARFLFAAVLPAVLFLFLSKAQRVLPVDWASAGAIREVPYRLVDYIQRQPENILYAAVPALAGGAFEGGGMKAGPAEILLEVLNDLARVRLDSPVAVFSSALPPLAGEGFRAPALLSGAPAAVSSTALVSEPSGRPAAGGEALVCIYNTHTGETYSLTDGKERLERLQGGVVTVAAALQEALEKKHGIPVARSDRINDMDYNNSYLESEKTARELLAANPKTRVILDIHRDSGKTREQSVISINGRPAAPILFIVGSDTRRPFPTWRQNHSFAGELSRQLNEMYPGLSLGVRVKDGLYNQHLHPGAVLVEIGTSRNSVEEAVRSAQFLADALAVLIKG